MYIKNKINLKLKQWMWFFALWCGGFITVFTIAYLIKIVIRSI